MVAGYERQETADFYNALLDYAIRYNKQDLQNAAFRYAGALDRGETPPDIHDELSVYCRPFWDTDSSAGP